MAYQQTKNNEKISSLIHNQGLINQYYFLKANGFKGMDTNSRISKTGLDA
jgi:hypothetical protein